MRNIFLKTLSILIITLFLLPSCTGSLPGADSWKNGFLVVIFNLDNAKDARAISDDFSLVSTGKVFLKQNGITKKQANLTINTDARTGTGEIADIVTGSYDIILELYDLSTRLLYDAVSTVTIVAGNNGTKTIVLEKYIGSLSVTGSWTVDIVDLAIATAELKKAGTTVYGTSLNISGKAVSGSFGSVYPDTYELYVAIRTTDGTLKFDGTKTITTTRGTNTTTIVPIPKTGGIAIQLGGDATAPVITNGPSYTISGTTATIIWATDEVSTSLVCYSSTPSFDYRSSLNWAPLGGDLSADMSNHSVTIAGLVDGATYYFVVVSADVAGNFIVSNESSLIVLPIPHVGLVGEWLFDGNAIDTSGNANNGTVNGAELANDRFGNPNSAYYFNRSSYIEIANSALMEYTTMTLSVWAKDNRDGTWNTSENSQGMILAKHVSTSGSGYFLGNIYSDSSTTYFIGNGGSNQAYATRIDQSWHFIIGTYDTGLAKLYIDGQFVSSIAFSPEMAHSTANIRIGSLSPGGPYYAYWEGIVDDARIYNRVLSDNEILSLYHEGGW